MKTLLKTLSLLFAVMLMASIFVSTVSADGESAHTTCEIDGIPTAIQVSNTCSPTMRLISSFPSAKRKPTNTAFTVSINMMQETTNISALKSKAER